jgi:hypothetical protein
VPHPLHYKLSETDGETGETVETPHQIQQSVVLAKVKNLKVGDRIEITRIA